MDVYLDETVRAMLEARRGRWQEIVKVAEVSDSWASQFVRRLIPNPGIVTLRKLYQAMRAIDDRDARRAAVPLVMPAEAGVRTKGVNPYGNPRANRRGKAGSSARAAKS